MLCCCLLSARINRNPVLSYHMAWSMYSHRNWGAFASKIVLRYILNHLIPTHTLSETRMFHLSQSELIHISCVPQNNADLTHWRSLVFSSQYKLLQLHLLLTILFLLYQFCSLSVCVMYNFPVVSSSLVLVSASSMTSIVCIAPYGIVLLVPSCCTPSTAL